MSCIRVGGIARLEARWYVVSFQPGKENVAELNLKRQGFDVWIPRQIRLVRHARRRYERRVPFFPGYMFISLDLRLQGWRQVNGTHGVKALIMQGEMPVPCPVGLVDELQAMAGAEGIVDASVNLALGDKVRITSGPFAEAVGTLVHMESASRIRILLEMMQGEVAVSVRALEVMPVVK